MLSALLGMTMALVLQQADVNRQHLQQEIICLYPGDDNSLWYNERHGGKYVTNVQWIDEEQYNAS